MNDLVQKLTRGAHPVEIVVRPKASVAGLKAAIDRGYVHVRFTDTDGGTELGFGLNLDESDLSNADFTSQTGKVKLAGDLTLDYQSVSCTAEIDLSSLAGRGFVAVRDPASNDAHITLTF